MANMSMEFGSYELFCNSTNIYSDVFKSSTSSSEVSSIGPVLTSVASFHIGSSELDVAAYGDEG